MFMKNYYKENEIAIVGGKHGYIQENGLITVMGGKDIFCGDCCKKYDLQPSSRNKKDMEKAREMDLRFYIDDNKTKIVCSHCGRELDITETYESMQEYVDERNRLEREDVHLIKVAHSWETGLTYYKLSARLLPEDWSKVKEYFHYHTKADCYDDEFYECEYVTGWVTLNPEKVEEVLGIPNERTVKVREEKREKEKWAKEKEKKELEDLVNKCKEPFVNIEVPEGSFDLDGVKVENPLFPHNVYGGGEWWVICDDGIWFVKNNGSDGANWSWNNVVTGGAGAIGRKISFNEELYENLMKLKKV